MEYKFEIVARMLFFNEEAGYKREENSPNFRDFLELLNLVLSLYKPKLAPFLYQMTVLTKTCTALIHKKRVFQ